jgi:hypothetical protein
MLFLTPPSTRCQGPVDFIDLLLAMKERIYEHVLSPNTRLYVAWNDPESTHSGAHSKITYGLPAICCTSKLERHIAIQAFLRATTLCLLWNNDAPLLTPWLRKITENKEDKFDSVRKLEFKYIMSAYFNNRCEDTKLFAACANLVLHTITPKIEELNIRDNDDPDDPSLGLFKVRGITGDELIANLSLAPLLKCVRLRCLAVNI